MELMIYEKIATCKKKANNNILNAKIELIIIFLTCEPVILYKQ